MLQEAAEVRAWFSLISTLLCSFKAGISGQGLEVLFRRLSASDATQKLGEAFSPAEEDGSIRRNLRAVAVSVYRFPEQLRLGPEIYEKESQIFPKRVCGIYVISRTTFSHVRVGQLGNRNKIV